MYDFYNLLGLLSANKTYVERMNLFCNSIILNWRRKWQPTPTHSSVLAWKIPRTGKAWQGTNIFFSHSVFCLFISLMIFSLFQSFSFHWWFPLLCRSFLVSCSCTVYFCFCCLYTWCQIQKVITKINIKEITVYIFF